MATARCEKKGKTQCSQAQWIGPSIDWEHTADGVRKTFYSAYKSQGMKILVGSFVKLHSPSHEPLPYIGRVHAMWQLNSAPEAQFIKIGWYWRHQDTHLAKRHTNGRPNEIFHSKHSDDNSILSVMATVQVVSQDVPGSEADGPFVCRRSYDPAAKTFRPYDFKKKSFARNRNKRESSAGLVTAAPTKRAARNTQRKQNDTHDGLDLAIQDAAPIKKAKRSQHNTTTKDAVALRPQTPPKTSASPATATKGASNHATARGKEILAALRCASTTTTALIKSVNQPMRELETVYEPQLSKASYKTNGANPFMPNKMQPHPNKLDFPVVKEAIDDYMSPRSGPSVPQRNQHRIGPAYQISRSQLDEISRQPFDILIGATDIRWDPNPKHITRAEITAYCKSCRQLTQRVHRIEVGGVYPVWHKEQKQFKWAVVKNVDPDCLYKTDGADTDKSAKSLGAISTTASRDGGKTSLPSTPLRSTSCSRMIPKKQRRGSLYGCGLQLLDVDNMLIRIRVTRPVRVVKQPTDFMKIHLMDRLVVRFKGEKGTRFVTVGDVWVHCQEDVHLAMLRKHCFDAKKALTAVGLQVVVKHKKLWSVEEQKEFVWHYHNVGKDFNKLAHLMRKSRKKIIEHYYKVKMRACNQTGLKPEPYCRGTRRLRPRGATRSTPVTWTCIRCTFANKISNSNCIMCGYNRRIGDVDGFSTALPAWGANFTRVDDQIIKADQKEGCSSQNSMTTLDEETEASAEFSIETPDLTTEKANYFVHKVKEFLDGSMYGDFQSNLQDYKEGICGVGDVINQITSVLKCSPELLHEFLVLIR